MPAVPLILRFLDWRKVVLTTLASPCTSSTVCTLFQLLHNNFWKQRVIYYIPFQWMPQNLLKHDSPGFSSKIQTLGFTSRCWTRISGARVRICILTPLLGDSHPCLPVPSSLPSKENGTHTCTANKDTVGTETHGPQFPVGVGFSLLCVIFRFWSNNLNLVFL